jgi:hypothetical protein
MRRQLIEALTYPRLLIQRLLEDRDCVHNSVFDATSVRCRDCDMNRECHWGTCLNDFVELADKPEHTLNASLRYGVRLVERYHSELRHDETACTCEACSWMRDAQRLIEEFENNLPPNPYRPVH